MKKMTAIFATLVTILASVSAQAQEAAAQAAGSSDKGLIAIAAAIAIGIAVFGGTSAQGKTASAALEGIARNPVASDKIFTPMILGLALIESLVILAFIIAFLVIPGL